MSTATATSESLDRYLTVSEFCRMTGISRRTFYAMEEAGTAPPRTLINRRKLILLSDAQRWQQRRSSVQPDA